MSYMGRAEAATITAVLGHVAGILEQLRLEEYEVALHDRATQAVAELPNTIEHRERQARWAALRAAARTAGNLVDHITRAMAHQRAAESAAAECAGPEPELQPRRHDGRGAVAFDDTHAAALRRAYPDTNVILMPRREEALPDDLA